MNTDKKTKIFGVINGYLNQYYVERVKIENNFDNKYYPHKMKKAIEKLNIKFNNLITSA